MFGWGWLALTMIGVPWLLSFAQPTIWQISRPWYLAWAGLTYIVAALATLGWIATTGRHATEPDCPVPERHVPRKRAVPPAPAASSGS
jgi:hypothetical protein